MIPDLTPPTQTSIRKPRASGDDPDVSPPSKDRDE